MRGADAMTEAEGWWSIHALGGLIDAHTRLRWRLDGVGRSSDVPAATPKKRAKDADTSPAPVKHAPGITSKPRSKQPPKVSPALTRIVREEQRTAQQLARDTSVQASTIDAALTPKRRAQLRAQQDAFLDARTHPARDSSRTAADSRGSKQRDTSDPVTRNSVDERRDPAAASDPVTRASGQSSSGGAGKRTTKEIAAFVATRSYWIDDDGAAWKVQTDAFGGATLERRNDRSGTLTKDPLATARRKAPSDGRPGARNATSNVTASGVVHVSVDGSRTVNLNTVTSSGHASSVERTHRVDIDEQDMQVGSSTTTTTRGPLTNGGSARVTVRTAAGTLAPTGAEPFSADVTTMDASGKETYRTSTAQPAVQPEPKNLDELRIAQDRLGTMEATIQQGAPKTPGSGDAPAIDKLVDYMSAKIDAGAVQHTNAVGVMKLAGTYDDYERAQQHMAPSPVDTVLQAVFGKPIADTPEVATYGDRTFAQVRDRLKSFGIDEQDGNRDIARDWQDARTDNAFYQQWSDRMEFGYRDGVVPLAMSDDVIAHEFTHRIVNRQAPGLPFEGEAGAINESLADTMAAAVDTEDWLMGEDAVPGGIRDMSKRTTISQYEKTSLDNGGVHGNSAIPNYAAYKIGSKVGRDDMGAIYAKALTDYVDDHETFKSLARHTLQAATDLYGATSHQADAVRDAWNSVLELHGSDRL